jgi:hypothetical protein
MNPNFLIEIKDVLGNNELLFFYGKEINVSKFFPTRFLDSKYLAGVYSKYINLWKSFVEQLRTNNDI